MNLTRNTVGFGIALGLCLAGCGGGGSSTPPATTTATASVSVDWPLRTRNVVGPTSALSVKIVLHPLTVTGSDITILGDRSSSLGAHTDSYKAGAAGAVGEWQLSATFYAGAGETGAVVATAVADVDVTVNGSLTNVDGTALSAIAFTSKIVRVAVDSAQTVTHGATQTLTATAYDASNNVIAISPGSLTWALASGSSNLTLAANGDATGLTEGTASVTALVDGVTSAAGSVTVSRSHLSIAAQPTDLAFAPTGHTLYASVVAWGTSGSPAILKIDGVTGAVQALPVTALVTKVVVTPSGSHLYGWQTDGTIISVDLSTFSLGASTVLSSSAALYPTQLIAIPGTSEGWAMATDYANEVLGPTYVFDALVSRTNTVSLGESLTVDAAGTTLYGYTKYSTPAVRLLKSTISSSGLSAPTQITSAIDGRNNGIHYLNAQLVGDDGTVVDATTGATIRTLSVPNVNRAALVASGSSNIDYLCYTPYQFLSFNSSSGSQTESFTLPGLTDGTILASDRSSEGTIAFGNIATSSPSIQIIGGLP